MDTLADLEAQFLPLAEEWREMEAARLIAWRGQMQVMMTEHSQLVDALRWQTGPADLLTVIGRSRRETYHSAIIAWLLNPQGRHGLGAEFLRRFLARCFPGQSFGDPNGAATGCEVVGKDCRADIVVEGEGWIVVIENKVDAAEGPEQCDRLYRAFSSRPGARFVLLTPLGRGPKKETTGDTKAAFACLSYSQVATELAGALSGVPAGSGSGRTAAVNYLVTLEAVTR